MHDDPGWAIDWNMIPLAFEPQMGCPSHVVDETKPLARPGCALAARVRRVSCGCTAPAADLRAEPLR